MTEQELKHKRISRLLGFFCIVLLLISHQDRIIPFLKGVWILFTIHFLGGGFVDAGVEPYYMKDLEY